MVEVLIALGVMFSALTVLAYTMLSGLSAVGESRQRTEATALANQALEQIRALPASQLFMSAADVAGDPQLIACGAATCFNGRTVPTAHFSAATTDPLAPHITTTTALPGVTTYTIKSYVTLDPTDTSGHTLVATVQVSWSNAEKSGVAASLQVESKIYNAQFNEAAPGIHTFLANASGSAGQIKITGTVLGNSLVDIDFNLPSTTSGMNGTSLPNSTNVASSASPTTNSTSAGISASGVTAAAGTVSVLATPTSSASASSLAGNGPMGATDHQTPKLVNSLPGILGIDAGSLTGSATAGSAETTSAEAASAADGSSPTSGSPALPTNGLGFGQATAQQSGVAGASVGANLNVTALGLPVLGIGLVKLTPTGNGFTTPDYSTVAQNGSASAPDLQTFNATANSEFSDLSILSFSGALGALFPGPLLDLNGFQQLASACAAPAGVTCTATPQVDTGTISILGGKAVSVTDLIKGLVPLSTVNNLLTGINLPLGGLTTLGVSGTGINVLSNQSPGSVPSPLSVNLMVNASLLGINLLNLTINITLGSATASASYN